VTKMFARRDSLYP